MSHKFSTKYRVYYEDTDAGGIVYHANYLRFCERSRTEYLRDLEVSQSDLVRDEKLIFVVRRCEIDYLFPAKLDDLIEVTAEVTKTSATSLIMHQEVKKDDKVLAAMDVVIVCIDSETYRPKKIPEKLKELFNA
jgi:acyl-CoA thioester hydrolase